MSKILLINPSIQDDGHLAQAELFPNGALMLLGTILKNEGHNVQVIHMATDRVTLGKLNEIVKDAKPEIIGITATSFQSKALREVSRVVKMGNSNVKVVAGGSHVSALISINHPISEDYPDIDYFVRGEGDFAISRIVEQEPTSNIITMKPMDNLAPPPIDLSLTNIRKFVGAYPLGPKPGMFIMGSRGCPFNCTFCSRSVFGKTVRYRNPIAIINEIEEMTTDWGIKEIFFHDDTFNLNRRWAEEILGYILMRKLNKRLRFRTPCRVNRDMIDMDLLRLMREAGFWLIFYGVESGSQMMLNKMRKGITVGEIVRAFRLTRKAGIKTEASFIVGLPSETKETVQDSIKLWKQIKPDWGSFTRAVPFPGTEFYWEARQSGHLLIDSFDGIEANKTLCRTATLTSGEIEKYAVVLDNMTLRRKLWQLSKNPINLARVIGNMKTTAEARRGIRRTWQLLHRARV